MTDKIRIFVDMDGTLARFHDENLYLERMFEKGFFRDLKPFSNAVDAIKRIIDNHPNVDVYVLSATITTPYCLAEKNAWLDKYLPNVDNEHRILMESSAGFKSLCVPGNYMYKDDNGKYHIKISENDILIDDYNKNLEGWERDGGTAIKAKNNINHIRWKRLRNSRGCCTKFILHEYGDISLPMTFSPAIPTSSSVPPPPGS